MRFSTAVVASVIVGVVWLAVVVFVFTDTPKQIADQSQKNTDLPARYIALAGLSVAFGKLLWDLWAAVEYVVITPIRQNFGHFGRQFGVELYNPGSVAINLRRVYLRLQIAGQAQPQEATLYYGEGENERCMLESRAHMLFYCPISNQLAAQNLEWIQVIVATPTGNVGRLRSGSIRPLLND